MLIKLPENFHKVDVLGRPHVGKVVFNEDPKKLGRVKCAVPNVFESSDPEELPWVYPKNPYGLGGSLTSSSFSVPEVGSELWVSFPNKDIYFPVYEGYLQSELTHQPLFDTNYPNSYGFLDPTGTYLMVDKTAKSVTARHATETDGSWFHIDQDGKLNVNIKSDVIINFDGDVDVKIAGNLVLSAASIFLTALSSWIKMVGDGIFGTSSSGIDLRASGEYRVDGSQVRVNEDSASTVTGQTADSNDVTPPDPLD